MKPRHLLASIACTVLLAACSAEPSSTDIQHALQTQSDKIIEASAGLFGESAAKMAKITIHSVEKLSCKETSEAPGYACAIKVDMTRPLIGRTETTTTVHVVQGKNGWEALN